MPADSENTPNRPEPAALTSSGQSYTQNVIDAVGAGPRAAASVWRPGRAGTAPDGTRFVVYATHIRSGGERGWRTNNPGNIRIGPFARANGAIGNDGQYAIFPDEQTGARALLTLLRTPGYAAITIREALLRHVPALDGAHEATARSRQFRLQANRAIGDLAGDEITNLGLAIMSTLSTRQPRIYKPRSQPQAPAVAPQSAGVLPQPSGAQPRPSPSWTRIAFAAAQTTRASAPAASPNYIYYPSNWQVGEWYVRQPDGTFTISPDQAPRAGAVGLYVRYNGNNSWDMVGRSAPNSGDSAAPNPNTPDPGNAVPPNQAPPDIYNDTITRDDGTTYTVRIAPPGSPLNVPDYAEVIPNSDGTFLILYNNDGSPWDASGEGETTDPGTQPTDTGTQPGGPADGGDGGDGNDPDPDPDATEQAEEGQ